MATYLDKPRKQRAYTKSAASKVAARYNFLLFQIKGMEACLGNMRQQEHADGRDGALESSLVNIWMEHSRNGLMELRSRIVNKRDNTLRQLREEAGE